MTSVVICSDRGRRKYITADTSLTTDLQEAEVFTDSPQDMARLNTFLSYLTKNFGSYFSLLEVQ